jgi:hypothetical protein
VTVARGGVDSAEQTVLFPARPGREEQAAGRLPQQAVAETQAPQVADFQHLAICRTQLSEERAGRGIERIDGGPSGTVPIAVLSVNAGARLSASAGSLCSKCHRGKLLAPAREPGHAKSLPPFATSGAVFPQASAHARVVRGKADKVTPLLKRRLRHTPSTWGGVWMRAGRPNDLFRRSLLRCVPRPHRLE